MHVHAAATVQGEPSAQGTGIFQGKRTFTNIHSARRDQADLCTLFRRGFLGGVRALDFLLCGSLMMMMMMMMMMMTLGGFPSFRDGAVQHGRVHYTSYRTVVETRGEALVYVLFVLN